MKRWGPALFWSCSGLAIVGGCGGRTDVFDDAYDIGGNGGSRAGSGQGGSFSGSRPTGGSATTAGTAMAFGGTGFAGTPIGGSFGVAGFGGMPAGGAAGFNAGGVGASSGAGPLPCQACLARACTPEAARCFPDVGCVAILACTLSSGCNPLQCYASNACKDLIDQFGGPAGDSFRRVQDVVGCALGAGCECP